MKKGLSVLLIVAALFGFYGGASSLTDVLACKDYWEKEGEKSTADMNKLEDGLNQLGENEQAYLDGVQKLAENEPKLEEGKQTLAEKEAEFAAAPAKLRAGENKLAAGKAAYKEGKKTYDAGVKQYKESEATLATLTKNVRTLEAAYAKWEGAYGTLKKAGMYPNYAVKGLPLVVENNAQDIDDAIIKANLDGLTALISTDVKPSAEPTSQEVTVQKQGELQDRAKKAIEALGAYKAGKIDLATAITTVIGLYDGAEDSLGKQIYTTAFNAGTLITVKGVNNGKATLVENLTKLLKVLKSNEDAQKKLKPYGGSDGLIKMLSVADDPTFAALATGLMKEADKLIDEGNAALAAARKQLSDGDKKLKAAAKQIKAGEAELAQGYADYKAAPAKLAAGRQQLADGLKQLEEGKKQLAQYEDGEQQVRDGLATLMSTEPNGGLESILDRRGGDDEFDDANGHLDVQEGLDAVKVGRGYQADSGELITKEITNRAVGTAAGLGAAVLACLAALLSLIKKYKGAAVTAVLAAIAGVAGAVVGNGAGSEFSNIAGSTVGSLPWIAAGVVAAVACVFAIVNFTAKAE